LCVLDNLKNYAEIDGNILLSGFMRQQVKYGE